LLKLPNQLTHFDAKGRAAMVDIGGKPENVRRAVASAFVRLAPETVAAVRNNQTPKGNPLEIARIAGIMAAKQTSNLIPLCHQINLSKIEIRADLTDTGIALESEAAATAQTGVEIEALTAVSIAALTVYDMCKSLDKSIVISDIRLEVKTGGKSGDFQRQENEIIETPV
jgi:cyclic pyranopterin phosphate synthase